MKKWEYAVLLLCLSFALAGCGSVLDNLNAAMEKAQWDDSSAPKQTQAASAAPAAPTAPPTAAPSVAAPDPTAPSAPPTAAPGPTAAPVQSVTAFSDAAALAELPPFAGKVDVSGRTAAVKSGQTVILTGPLPRFYDAAVEISQGAAVTGIEFLAADGGIAGLTIRQGGSSRIQGDILTGPGGIIFEDPASYLQFNLREMAFELYGSAVIAARGVLAVRAFDLALRGDSVMTVKAGARIEVGSAKEGGGRKFTARDTSKIILERGGVLRLLGAAEGSGSLTVEKGAGLYGGTKAAPNSAGIKLSALRTGGAPARDILSITADAAADAGAGTVPGVYTVSVVPSGGAAAPLVLGTGAYGTETRSGVNAGAGLSSHPAGEPQTGAVSPAANDGGQYPVVSFTGS